MMDIQIDTLFTTTLQKENLIPYEAITTLSQFFRHKAPDLEYSLQNLFHWANEDSEWRQWITEDGKWTKRFALAVRAKGDTINNSLMGYIGSIMGEFVVTSERTFYWEFAKFSDWQHGRFEGSVSEDGKPPGHCWWGDWSDFRLGLPRHPGGFSVLFYEDEQHYKAFSKTRGIGRCWAYNNESGLAIFNSYGVSLNMIARVIASQLGAAYAKIINVKSPGAWINTGFFNNLGRGGGPTGSGILITNEKVSPSVIYLPDFANLPNGHCCICQAELVKRRSFHFDGEYYCAVCREERFCECGKCGNSTSKEKAADVTYYDRKITVCPICYVKANHCSRHGKVLHETYSIWHTPRTGCDICVGEGTVTRCKSCHKYTDKYVTVKIQGVLGINLCRSCHSKLEVVHHD